MDPLNLLQELLAFPSHLDEGKKAIADYCATLLEEWGMDVRILEEGCDPVVFATKGAPSAYLNGHLDVVPPGSGWTRETGEVADGKVYGRGVLDMKGPVASLLVAVNNLLEQNLPVGVILTTDEETTMRGARAVVEKGLLKKTDYILVCEPTGFKRMTDEKGVLHYTVKAVGKSAHGSMPEQGISSLEALMSVYHKTQRTIGKMKDTTLNLGTMKGGDQVNMVPRNGRMELDVRFPHIYSWEELQDLLFIIEPDNDATIIYDVDQYLDPWKSSGSKGDKVLTALSEGEYSAPYATEATIFQKACNAGVFGPGNPLGAHIPDEEMPVAELEKASALYEEFVKRMA